MRTKLGAKGVFCRLLVLLALGLAQVGCGSSEGDVSSSPTRDGGGGGGPDSGEGPDSKLCDAPGSTPPTLRTQALGSGSFALIAFSGCSWPNGAEASVTLAGHEYAAISPHETELVAFLERVPAGTRRLTLRLNERSWDLSFTYLEAPEVRDPEALLAAFQTQLLDELLDVEDAELRALGQQKLAEFRAGLPELDEDLRAQLAAILVANGLLPDGIEKATGQVCGTATPETWTECLEREIRDALLSNALTLAVIVGGAIVAGPTGALVALAGAALAAKRTDRLLHTLAESTGRVLQAVIDGITMEKSFGPVEARSGEPFDVRLRAPYVRLASAELADAPLLRDMLAAFEEARNVAHRTIAFFGLSKSVPGLEASTPEERWMPAMAFTASSRDPNVLIAQAGDEEGLQLTLSPKGSLPLSGLIEVTLHYEHTGVASADLTLTVSIVEDAPQARCHTAAWQDESIAACGNGVLDSGERCDSGSEDEQQRCAGATLCEVALGAGAELRLAHATVTGPALVSFEERALGPVPTHIAFAGGSFEAYRPIAQCERVYFKDLHTSFPVRAYGERNALALSIADGVTVERSAEAEWEMLKLSSGGMPVSLRLSEIANEDGTYSTVPTMPLDLELVPGAWVQWAGGALGLQADHSAVTLPLRVLSTPDGAHVVGLHGALFLPAQVLIVLNGMNAAGPITLPLTTRVTNEGNWSTGVDGPVNLSVPEKAWVHWQTGIAYGPVTVPLTTIELDGYWTPVLAGPAKIDIPAGGRIEFGEIQGASGDIGGSAGGPVSLTLTTLVRDSQFLEGSEATTALHGAQTVAIGEGGDLFWEGGLALGPLNVPVTALQKESGEWTSVFNGPATVGGKGMLAWEGGRATNFAGLSFVSVLDEGGRYRTVLSGESSATLSAGGELRFGESSVFMYGPGTFGPLRSVQTADHAWHTVSAGQAMVTLGSGGRFYWPGGDLYGPGSAGPFISHHDATLGAHLTVLGQEASATTSPGGGLWWGMPTRYALGGRIDKSAATVPLASRQVQGEWVVALRAPVSVTPGAGTVHWHGGYATGNFAVPLVDNPLPNGTPRTVFGAPSSVILPAGAYLQGLGSGPRSGTLKNYENSDGTLVTLPDGVVQSGSCASFREYATYAARATAGTYSSVHEGAYCRARADCSGYACCGTATNGSMGTCTPL